MMNILNKMLYTYEITQKDSEGYLKNTKDWNVILAEEIAYKENINLTPDHWKIIMFVRKFYFTFNTTPSMRMLIKSIGSEIGQTNNNSIYLFKLFPQGPAKQASKIAGIPKPTQCL